MLSKLSKNFEKCSNQLLDTVQQNDLNFKSFSFLQYYGDQNGGQMSRKYVNWKPPKLYKGKDKWWVEYYGIKKEELCGGGYPQGLIVIAEMILLKLQRNRPDRA